MAGVCTGENFCCWVPQPEGPSIVCPHNRDDGPDATRRFVCTLREALGSWGAVRASEAYQETPGAVWDAMDSEHCDEWPMKACGSCGYVSVEVT